MAAPMVLNADYKYGICIDLPQCNDG